MVSSHAYVCMRVTLCVRLCVYLCRKNYEVCCIMSSACWALIPSVAKGIRGEERGIRSWEPGRSAAGVTFEPRLLHFKARTKRAHKHTHTHKHVQAQKCQNPCKHTHVHLHTHTLAVLNNRLRLTGCQRPLPTLPLQLRLPLVALLGQLALVYHLLLQL